VGVLNACASVGALEDGRHAHEQIIQKGWESDFGVGSSLVDMYAKCGSMEEAWRVFSSMPAHDVVSCTAMIFGHLKHGQVYEALYLISTNATRRFATRPCHFCGGAKCLCQCRST
jgi:pentatricopeptide repeat protein